jgi:isocitrate/isopropylmalate dehydrogenase
VRNIEDTYGGIEHWQTPDVVQQLRIITRPGSEVFIRFAFELARPARATPHHLRAQGETSTR